jgi:hypothetical protein
VKTAGLFLCLGHRPSPKLGAFVARNSPPGYFVGYANRSSPFDVVPDARGAKAANLKAV